MKNNWYAESYHETFKYEQISNREIQIDKVNSSYFQANLAFESQRRCTSCEMFILKRLQWNLHPESRLL